MAQKKKTKSRSEFKYRVDISWSPDDESYVVKVPELQGCTTHGDTWEEAVQNAREAIAAYISSLEKRKLPVPKPLVEQKFSGKIPLRIDPNLHRDLAVRAHLEGTSLNRYIENKLKRIS